MSNENEEQEARIADLQRVVANLEQRERERIDADERAESDARTALRAKSERTARPPALTFSGGAPSRLAGAASPSAASHASKSRQSEQQYPDDSSKRQQQQQQQQQQQKWVAHSKPLPSPPKSVAVGSARRKARQPVHNFSSRPERSVTVASVSQRGAAADADAGEAGRVDAARRPIATEARSAARPHTTTLEISQLIELRTVMLVGQSLDWRATRPDEVRHFRRLTDEARREFFASPGYEVEERVGLDVQAAERTRLPVAAVVAGANAGAHARAHRRRRQLALFQVAESGRDAHDARARAQRADDEHSHRNAERAGRRATRRRSCSSSPAAPSTFASTTSCG